jgi:hypothetical protein
MRTCRMQVELMQASAHRLCHNERAARASHLQAYTIVTICVHACGTLHRKQADTIDQLTSRRKI